MKAYKYCLLLVLLSLFILLLLGSLGGPGADWLIYMNGALRYKNHLPLYHVWKDGWWGFVNFSVYSPLFSFILIPATFLPIWLSMTLWTILKLILLLRIFKIVANWIGFFFLPDKQKAIILLVSYLFVLRFLLYDFNLGQITVFLLWTMLEGWHKVKKGNNIVGGLLLSSGLFIKTISIVFIPYLIYKKRFKALAYFFGCMIALALLPFLTGNWNYHLMQYKGWTDVILPYSTDAPFTTDAEMKANIATLTLVHDLHIAIPAWYFAVSSPLHSIVQFNDLSLDEINRVLYFCLICMLLAFLFIPGTKPFSKTSDEKTELAEVSYILALVPIIFPHQQKYSYVLMIPLIMNVAYSLFSRKVKSYYLVIAFVSLALMALTTDGIIGRPLNLITQQLKFVTIGALILVALFFMIKRDERREALMTPKG